MLWGSLDGRGVWERMNAGIYMAECLGCSPETTTTLLTGYTSVQNCSMSGSNCYLLTHRFLRRQVRWSGIPISWRIFQFVVIHTIKGFSIVNESKIDVFLKSLCFFYDPIDVGNLISGSSISNSSLYMWKFLVHVLLKPSLKDFEY